MFQEAQIGSKNFKKRFNRSQRPLKRFFVFNLDRLFKNRFMSLLKDFSEKERSVQDCIHALQKYLILTLCSIRSNKRMWVRDHDNQQSPRIDLRI